MKKILPKKVLLALVPALAGLLILTTSAFAWQPRIEGMLHSFSAGSTAGYYFWHDSNGLHLWTTDPDHVESLFTGTITTDGQFVNVGLEKPENDDHFVQTGPDQISFSFHTYDGIDGLDFEIAGGDDVTLSLQRDGHDISVDHVFLGAYSVHPEHNPFTVDR